MTDSLQILLIALPESLLEHLAAAGTAPSSKRVDSEDELVRELSEKRWDVVLSAYALPGFEVSAAIALVRSRDVDLPFIVVCNPIGEEVSAELMRAGASDIVTLPRVARLGGSIERALREARRRRRAREALIARQTPEELEARRKETDPETFRALVENSPDLIARFGPDLRRMYVNPAIERLTGLPARELIGTTLREINFDERFVIRIEDAMKIVFATGADRTIVVRLPGAGGERVYQARIVPELDGDGEVRSVLVVSRDISALHRSEARLRDLIRTAHDAILTLELSGTIQEVNPALEKMIDLPAAEIVGRHLSELTTPESAAAMEASLRAVFEGNRPAQICTQFVTRTGTTVEVEATASRQSHDGTEAIFVIARDVTERKRAEAEAEEAKRLVGLGRITTLVSHEFNNVLMGIQPYADALRRVSGEPKVAEMAERIAQSVRRGRRITEDLRAFTRPSVPAIETIELREWITTLAREIEEMLPPELPLSLELGDFPPTIPGDRKQLALAITNLVFNARDAMRGRRGSIRLAVDSEAGPDAAAKMVRISVADDGPGIPPEDLPLVFEAFFTTRQKAGLGLTTARQIVLAHGGRISVESPAGGGTVARVLLPAR